MAKERDKAEWNRMASLLATIENQNKVSGKPVQPSERTPYGKGEEKNGIPLRKDSLHVLKKLTQGYRR